MTPTIADLEITAEHRVHGGTLRYARHHSAATGTSMRLTVFQPERPSGAQLIWLSGLTCTEDNFTAKAGAYGQAAALGLTLVAPDTSPRGEGVADDPAYDLGQGAGFYIDATQAPWAAHFRMESYITQDLIAVLDRLELDPDRRGVSGHSMGGHGSLTLALKHPRLFRSVSAFSPIAAPSQAPWGRKAFAAYLGSDEAAWRAHDAAALMQTGAAQGRYADILIDQGTADDFLEAQLKPHLFTDACAAVGQKATLRLQPGYDHSYFFIQSFIAEHLAFHAAALS